MRADDRPVVLKVEDLSLSFGGLQALDSVTFEVKQGEIFGIIGPNGAGKSCVFNCMNGFYRPNRGEIYFEEKRITKMRPDKIAQLGISRTFQNIQLYSGLSVAENFMAARHFLFNSTWIEAPIYFLVRTHGEEVKHRRAVEDVIRFLDLEPYRKTKVNVMSYGLRKRVDLGRALCQNPRLLILDEPMAGVDATLKGTMARTILDVQEEKGITIVIIEHDMGVVMDLCDRVMVLDFGRKIAEGPPEQIRQDPEVIKAYIGEEVAVTK
ncbi:ABC transporter ATP-binding protein [Chloroflexota bacterium]